MGHQEKLLESSFTDLVEEAKQCRRCPLWKRATQTVFGAGPLQAAVMLVGEQPGDQEDLQGKPFVGPAGKLLDQAFQESGITRKDVYLTNAVKHFKWEERGKRRIHKKPAAGEIAACSIWLQKELDYVRPRVLVALGATAAQALFGKEFRLTLERGRIFSSRFADASMATWHPSAVLRVPDPMDRKRRFEALVEDFRLVRSYLA